MRNAWPLLSTLILFTASCGDDGTSVDPDAASADAGAPDATTGCNALDNSGAMIEEMRIAEDPPAPLGGTLPDGEYHLIARTIYTGVGGATGSTGQVAAQTSMMIGGVASTVAEGPAGLATIAPTVTIVRENYVLVASGTALTLDRTCPEAGTTGFDAFTETVDGLILFDTANHSAWEYRRVP